MPDPSSCAEGARRCGTSSPELCRAGAWQAMSPCEPEDGCVWGSCLTRRCIDALDAEARVGCLHALAFPPNAEGATRGGGIDGVVVTNPSPDPVTVSIRHANEFLPLAASAQVFDGTGEIRISSRVLAENGDVLADAVELADFVEIPGRGSAELLLDPAFRFDPVTEPNDSRLTRAALTVFASRPVIVHQFMPWCCSPNASNGVSLVVPVGRGAEDRYILAATPALPSGPYSGNFPAGVTVAPLLAGTRTWIEFPRDGIPRYPDGVQSAFRRVTSLLGAGEALHLSVWNGDPSGARVTASGPIGVVASHACTNYPLDEPQACDFWLNYQSPTREWGSSFPLVPAPPRGFVAEPTYWRVVAGEAGATLRFEGSFEGPDAEAELWGDAADCLEMAVDGAVQLEPFATCRIGSNSPGSLEATSPVSVLGIVPGLSPSHPGRQWGGPSAFGVLANRHFASEWFFPVAPSYESSFVTLVGPLGDRATLDGTIVSLDWEIPGTELGFAYVEVESGHHVVAATGAVSATVFSYDGAVGTAYVAGANGWKDD